MDVRTELENISNIKQGTKEDGYEYTVRLAETIDRELPDEAFESLSDSAKSWMNKAITSYKTQTKLPEFPSVIKTESTESTTMEPLSEPLKTLINTLDHIDITNVNPVSTPTKGELNKLVVANLVTELKPKRVKKVKVKKTSSDDPSSSSDIRDIICQNYSLSLPEIEAVLTEKKIPFKSDLVRNVLAYMTATTKTLNKLGLLKNPTFKGASESEKLRELICANPTLGVKEIQQAVIEQGIDCNKATVSVSFYHIRSAIQTLKKFDMIK